MKNINRRVKIKTVTSDVAVQTSKVEINEFYESFRKIMSSREKTNIAKI